MKNLRVFYVVFTHAVILFLLVVAVTHAGVAGYYHVRAATTWRRLPEIAKRNYDHMLPADAADLLQATAKMRYRFAPWIGMRERPMVSRFVNVSVFGIRTNRRPMATTAELQDAIWFFGGSTTFGYGVADHESIPARLETALGRPVMNFGVAAFFTAQENLRLVQVLRYGYRPSQVIFLDGINESCDIIDDSEADARLEGLLEAYNWQPLEIARPVVYLAEQVQRRVSRRLGGAPATPAGEALVCDGQQPLSTVHARLMAEREVLCRLNGLQCTTFVQPFAGLHGRHDDYQSLPPSDRQWFRDKFAMLEDNWRASGSVFVTGALDRHPLHAYVDSAHYSQAANALVAEAIAKHLTAGTESTSATRPAPSATVPQR